MGKGVLSDEHSQSVAAARNLALQSADVILLLGNLPSARFTLNLASSDALVVCLLTGARLNWILHFGQTPRYNKDVKFIHVRCPALMRTPRIFP